VIRSFKGGTAGIGPVGTLALLKGTLYGVTDEGGAPLSGNLCCGTVFTARKSGRGTLLYRFYGTGGLNPSSVMAFGGALYGTTALGGLRGSYGMGYGTVFSVSTSGVGHLLYKFAGSPDGDVPIGAPSAANGVLYGTTAQGGAHGAGSVYEISTSGTEHVLYSFKGGSDGSSPRAGLTYLDGAFYGVTTGGGLQNCGGGCGTLFRISTSGAEKILYAAATAIPLRERWSRCTESFMERPPIPPNSATAAGPAGAARFSKRRQREKCACCII
jgi:uncharacterized repeat protein (TIGR03803 family)